jgi:hypothetical protein
MDELISTKNGIHFSEALAATAVQQRRWRRWKGARARRAEWADRGGAEPRVNAGGVERSVTRWEQPQLSVRHERREADDTV